MGDDGDRGGPYGSGPTASHRGAAGWVPPACLGFYFAAVSAATAPASHRAQDAATLTAVYLFLGAVLHFGSVAAYLSSRLGGMLASLGVGALATWHLREQVRLPVEPLAFTLWGCAAGLLYFLLLTRFLVREAGGAGRALLAGGVATGLLVAALAWCFHSSPILRWHLLRHNRLLGTPTYYLLAEPIESVRERIWSLGSAVASEGLSRAGPEIDADAAAGPHIVFVMIDTMRADALSAYGGDPRWMPELDRFAARSWVFTDVLSNAAWTRPSVASFFTGLLPEQHGVADLRHRLPERCVTLAERLERSGYATAAFVANHAVINRAAGFAQGFEVFTPLGGEPNRYARAEQVNEAIEGWLDEFATRAEQGRRPLFLYAHYLDPHEPYLSGRADSRHHELARQAYRSELRYLDGWLGRLFEAVGDHLRGPAIWFVTSDHGEEFGEHGGRGHGKALYREVTSIPAILRTPDGRAGALGDALEARDFFDLLIELSQRPDLDVRAWAQRRRRSQRHTSSFVTIRTRLHRPYLSRAFLRGFEEDRHFLIWSAYGPTYELYDLDADPGQHTNLVGQRPDLVATLARNMEQGIGRWAARVPVVHVGPDEAQLLRDLGYVSP